MIWLLDKKGEYTTRSMYRNMVHRGCINRRAQKLWKSKMPNKLKVFLWQAFQDRLPTKVEMKKKGWKGQVNCILCNKPEDGDHIFFNCIMARFVWASIKEALGWDKSPTSVNDFLYNWMPEGRHSYNVALFYFACLTWGVWKDRNARETRKQFARNPANVLQNIFLSMQRWKILLRAKDREKLENILEKCQSWYHQHTRREAQEKDEELL